MAIQAGSYEAGMRLAFTPREPWRERFNGSLCCRHPNFMSVPAQGIGS